MYNQDLSTTSVTLGCFHLKEYKLLRFHHNVCKAVTLSFNEENVFNCFLKTNQSSNLAAVTRVMNSTVEIVKEKHTYLLEFFFFQGLTQTGSAHFLKKEERGKNVVPECVSALDHTQMKCVCLCMCVCVCGLEKG